MSCLTQAKVFQVRVGEKVSYLARIRDYNLSEPNAVLRGSIVDAEGTLVGPVIIELLDQELNRGCFMMGFDARTWQRSQVGLTYKFDLVLEIDNPTQPDTVYPTPLMYLEVLESPTLSLPVV